MTFAEAVAAIQTGHRVSYSILFPERPSFTFWLEHDNKNRPVLMGRWPGHDKAIRNLVFSSEHFNTDLVWEIDYDKPQT